MPATHKIPIACDHAAVEIKNKIISEFKTIHWDDLGTNNNSSVDYPDYAKLVAEKISNNQSERGILICGSGIGMSIAANRYPHVRAALAYTPEAAKLSREHNDANVLCLSARLVDDQTNIEIVEAWLNAEFSNEPRHQNRVRKIELKK